MLDSSCLQIPTPVHLYIVELSPRVNPSYRLSCLSPPSSLKEVEKVVVPRTKSALVIVSTWIQSLETPCWHHNDKYCNDGQKKLCTYKWHNLFVVELELCAQCISLMSITMEPVIYLGTNRAFYLSDFQIQQSYTLKKDASEWHLLCMKLVTSERFGTWEASLASISSLSLVK